MKILFTLGLVFSVCVFHFSALAQMNHAQSIPPLDFMNPEDADFTRPLAWVYAGPGVCSGCPESLATALRKSGFRTAKAYPGNFNQESFDLNQVALIAVPGGDEELDVRMALGDTETNAIHHYVENGGHYLGVCLGAFLAVDWLIDTKEHVNGLNLFQGSVFNHSPTPNPLGHFENILWRGTHRMMYFQDGPDFKPSKLANATVWATYADGKIAAFQAPLKKGRVGLIGPHPEADPTWWKQDGLPTDPDGMDYDLLSEFSAELIKENTK